MIRNFAFTWNTIYLSNFADKNIRGFWCDGILVPDMADNTVAGIITHRQEIAVKAWFGRCGQDDYELTIKFGPQAISAYKSGNTLYDCLPDETRVNWINIDADKKKIILHLQ